MGSIFLICMDCKYLGVFYNNEDSFCVFFHSVKFGMAATSFAALRDTVLANRLITLPPIFVFALCSLTSISSADSSHCFLHSSGGFNLPLQRQWCTPSAWVSPHSGGFLSECGIIRRNGYMHHKSQHPHTPHLGCCISPFVTTNSLTDNMTCPPKGEVKSRFCHVAN